MITNKKGKLLGAKNSSVHIKKIFVRVINLLQDYKRGDIVVVLSCLWLMACEVYEVEPNDVLGTAHRIMNETEDDPHNSQFKAMKEYMRDEL